MNIQDKIAEWEYQIAQAEEYQMFFSPWQVKEIVNELKALQAKLDTKVKVNYIGDLPKRSRLSDVHFHGFED